VSFCDVKCENWAVYIFDGILKIMGSLIELWKAFSELGEKITVFVGHMINPILSFTELVFAWLIKTMIALAKWLTTLIK